MKFGITMFPVADFSLSPVRLAILVEEYGFESLFLPEHSHVPVSRETPFPTGINGVLPDFFHRFHDPLESLAAAAAVTTRIRLGTSTLVIPDHDPIMLAKRVATIDHISNGRVELGVGVGWNLEEMRNHGVDPQYRFSIFEERVLAMQEIWANDEASFHGRFVNFDPIWQWPKPIQNPLPVLIGGTSPKVLERVLRFGTGWIGSARHLDGEGFVARVLELQEMASHADRGQIPVTLQQGTPTPEAIELYGTAPGLVRITFRVDHGDEASVERQLETYAKLVAPYDD